MFTYPTQMGPVVDITFLLVSAAESGTVNDGQLDEDILVYLSFPRSGLFPPVISSQFIF